MRIEISVVLGAFGLVVLPYVGALGFAANAVETSEPCTIIETPGKGAAAIGGSTAGGLSSSVTVGGGKGSATTTLGSRTGGQGSSVTVHSGGGGKGSATTKLGSRSDTQGSSVTVHSGGSGSAAVATSSASANGTTVVTGSGGECIITMPGSDKTK